MARHKLTILLDLARASILGSLCLREFRLGRGPVQCPDRSGTMAKTVLLTGGLGFIGEETVHFSARLARWCRL